MSVVIIILIVAWCVTVQTVSRTVERVGVARAKNSKGAAGTPARTPWSQRGEARKFASEVWRDGFASAHGRYSKAKRKHGEKQTKRQELRDAGIDDRGPLRRVAGDLTAGARAKLRADWDTAWDKKRRKMRERWPDFPWPEWSGMNDSDDEGAEKPEKDGGQADTGPKDGEGEKPAESPDPENTDTANDTTSESSESTDTDTAAAGEQTNEGPNPTTDTDPDTSSDVTPDPVTDTSTEGDQQTVTATDPGLSEYGTLTGIVTKIDEKRTTLQTNGQRARDLADAARAYEDEAPEIADAADVVDRAMTALDDETDRLRDIVASAQELNAQHGRNLSQSSMDYNRDE